MFLQKCSWQESLCACSCHRPGHIWVCVNKFAEKLIFRKGQLSKSQSYGSAGFPRLSREVSCVFRKINGFGIDSEVIISSVLLIKISMCHCSLKASAAEGCDRCSSSPSLTFGQQLVALSARWCSWSQRKLQFSALTMSNYLQPPEDPHVCGEAV